MSTFRILIIIIVCLSAVSILGGIFFWWPNFQDFRDLQKELEEKEKELNQKKEYFAKLDVISEKIKKYSEEIAKVESALAIDPSIPALFDFIKKTASENGLAVERLALGGFSSSREIPEVNEISFSLSLSGSYPAFKNFLSAVYKNSRIIEIEHIAFSSPQENNLFIFSLSLISHSYFSGGQQQRGQEGRGF